jgi:osmotically-inducible protein OsmY
MAVDPSSIQKADAAMREDVYSALWKDDVLRAMESDDIDVLVNEGIVSLNGHIMSTTSQGRIENALRNIPGILGIENNLVLDDKLSLEVAASLGTLEHTYDCKFLTGASHGVISLNGRVGNENVSLLAEKSAANNPNVRGVINNVRVSGVEPRLQDLPFLQPAKGETIYFLDGLSGVVKQVIINPDTRRVIAMTLQGKLNNQEYGVHPLTDGEASLPEQLISVPMSVVRYLTKVSGFLSINSSEKDRYVDFDPAYFIVPSKGWVPPFPYCPDDVLFPIEYQETEAQIPYHPHRFSFGPLVKDARLSAQLLANDSLGG